MCNIYCFDCVAIHYDNTSWRKLLNTENLPVRRNLKEFQVNIETHLYTVCKYGFVLRRSSRVMDTLLSRLKMCYIRKKFSEGTRMEV